MESQTLNSALEPFLADPSGSALLLDVDGTLAPIVEHAEDATVPVETRRLLLAIAQRYGLLACVTGRRASDARAMVAIGSISYLGAHGAEMLAAGATESVLDRRLAQWVDRVREFHRELDTVELHRRRVRIEDKGSILALHWRGATDEEAAKVTIDQIAELARSRGFEVHWGRMVMEVRPPVPVNKGTGVEALLRGQDLRNVLFAGDDVTDLDGFEAIRRLQDDGTIMHSLCVGVASDEGPVRIVEEADVVVEGTAGVQALLSVLNGDSSRD